MIRVEHTITIEAPVEQVFNYAADFRKWHEWFQGVSDVRNTTATVQGNGARYAYRVSIMTTSTTVETEIHDFVPNQGWTGIATKGIPHRTKWIFAPVGSATEFTYVVEGRLPVPLLGPLCDSLFLKPQWEKIVQNSLSNLRQHFLASAGTMSR
jgi:uncharacterized membrane protein